MKFSAKFWLKYARIAHPVERYWVEGLDWKKI